MEQALLWSTPILASAAVIISLFALSVSKREASAAESSASTAQAEAARKPCVRVELVDITPPELPFADGDRMMTVRLTNKVT